MTDATIQRIQDDFTNEQGPFDGLTFPEEELVERVDPQNEYERAMVLTAFCTLDYNRDARQLADNLVELYEDSSVWFAPRTLVSDDTKYEEQDLNALMEHIGFRYPNRDTSGLWKNYEIIAEKYSTIQGLLDSVDHNAAHLVERLNEDGFKYLKGDKLAPFYARVIHDEIHELDEIWAVDIPVDTHIRGLTQKLTNDPLMDDDEIREFWREQGEENGVERHLVDGALWHIGNQWSDWGMDYWHEVTA